MDKIEIKTMELVRQIRNSHYEQLKGKTRAERIAFYRAKAASMQAKIQSRLNQRPLQPVA